jgi:RNA polymerase sigma-70 factor (ECF subfamily)
MMMLENGVIVATGVLPGVSGARRPLTIAELESCYALHARPLWAYLRRMSGSAVEADDLLQKSFLRLLEAPLPTLDEAGLRRYLYRIATNISIDSFRSMREGEMARAEQLPVDSSAILRADMQRMFERLKPRERALLWLAHVEGYDHQDLASMLGVGAKSVRVLLFRARKKLQQMMERDGRKVPKR